jgi:hypothetical protein
VTTRALEVRILRDTQDLELGRFTSTLGRVATSLREIDRATVEKGSRPAWIVDDLVHKDRAFVVHLTARPRRADRDWASLLRPIEALVDGVRSLADTPAVPPYYSEATVSRLMQIGKPEPGVSEVSLATVNGAVEHRAQLSSEVLENARKAVREDEVSTGSITGRLDILNARAKSGRLRISLLDPATRHAVTGSAPPGMSEELREAFGHRVAVFGRITRNHHGQAIRIQVSAIQQLPDDDSGRPSTEELLGIAPDWLGDLSVDDYLREARRA